MCLMGKSQTSRLSHISGPPTWGSKAKITKLHKNYPKVDLIPWPPPIPDHNRAKNYWPFKTEKNLKAMNFLSNVTI